MQRLLAEGLGTTFLLATVIGSGIMGETLAEGNAAIALLGNTIPTGAILVVLITIFGPISGAHFNPAVTLAFFLKRDISFYEAGGFIIVQIIGGILGVWAAHLMFAEDVLQISMKMRSGPAQGFSELVASFGLLIVIFGGIRHKPDAIPVLVGLYITAAYWFTASTSFANPAVTIARMWSDTFAGIAPASAPLFIAMQLIGAVLAVAATKPLFFDTH
ncbi:MAG: aquaporin family protein [Amylibacter sp.]|nr:aquaporin family protein [Amylibacter sp.]